MTFSCWIKRLYIFAKSYAIEQDGTSARKVLLLSEPDYNEYNTFTRSYTNTYTDTRSLTRYD